MHDNKKDRVLSLPLIKQAQQGFDNARSALADLARDTVYIYIYRMTLDHHIADDLCQETMVTLLESISRLQISTAKQFWAWLYRTALGKIQKHYRCQGNE